MHTDKTQEKVHNFFAYSLMQHKISFAIWDPTACTSTDEESCARLSYSCSTALVYATKEVCLVSDLHLSLSSTQSQMFFLNVPTHYKILILSNSSVLMQSNNLSVYSPDAQLL